MSYYSPASFPQLGLGAADSGETPEIKTLPWNIGKKKVASKSEVMEKRWGLALGLMGGLAALAIVLREVRAARARKKKR